MLIWLFLSFTFWSCVLFCNACKRSLTAFRVPVTDVYITITYMSENQNNGGEITLMCILTSDKDMWYILTFPCSINLVSMMTILTSFSVIIRQKSFTHWSVGPATKPTWPDRISKHLTNLLNLSRDWISVIATISKFEHIKLLEACLSESCISYLSYKLP